MMLLESPIPLLENIYNTGVIHGDCHMTIKILYSKDHRQRDVKFRKESLHRKGFDLTWQKECEEIVILSYP
jgi:hypothetical protein